MLIDDDISGARMPLCLGAREGKRYLSPIEVVRRLQSEFAYVETSTDDAQQYVLEVIQQLRTIEQTGKGRVDEAYLTKLERIHDCAMSVHFGDDLGSEEGLLSAPLLPEEPLVFECPSPTHEQVTRPLIARCAAALGYELVGVPQVCM